MTRHSPVTALTWEIWVRNRKWVALIFGLIFACWVSSVLLPASMFETDGGQTRLNPLSTTLMFVSLIFALAIFSYTELNPQRESIGFPHRLFTLPVNTLLLVSVPVVLGVAFVELVFVSWAVLLFPERPTLQLVWPAVLLGSFTVTYQTMMWTLGELGSARMIALGITGIIFITFAFLPSFPPEMRPAWMSEQVLIPAFIVWALIAFVGAWIYVTHERHGGGGGSKSARAVVEQLADALPRRQKPFRSSSAAQFWLEWRCSGLILPLTTGGLLLIVLAPLSWHMRNDATGSAHVLVAALVMPILLALPVGKAFSKPNFWSSDLSFPSFIAVRPMTTDDFIKTKLKVAALSAAISWSLVLVFLGVWLSLWANVDSINIFRILLWAAYRHSYAAQYALAVLSIIAGLLVTWRLLVGSLWLGLSGNGKLFGITAVPYAFLPFVGLIGTLILVEKNESVLQWLYSNLDGLLPYLVWIATVAVIAKFWTAALTLTRHREYWMLWLGGTFCLVALALLLWVGLRYIIPGDMYRLQSLTVLIALLMIPVARIGLASKSLARSRHG